MASDLMKRYEENCDIIVIDESTKERWPMMSQLLKSHSLYFSALLSKEWNHNKKSEFELKLNDSWLDIRNYLFFGKLRFRGLDLIVPALEFCETYSFDILFQQICKHIIKNVPDFKTAIEPHLEYLMQPQYFNILIPYRNQIITNYFDLSPTFSVIATVVAKESQTLIKNSNWITQSLSYEGYDFQLCPKIDSHIEFIVKMIPTLYLQMTSFVINIDRKDFSSQVFGIREEIEESESNLVKLFTKHTPSSDEFFSQFLIKISTPPNTQFFIHNFEINGQVKQIIKTL